MSLILPDTRSAKILVVGDVMLDRYWFGDVERISPEAPVPVVQVNQLEERPGGAANVARNAAALGAGVHLLSVIGDDEAGEVLAQLMEDEKVLAVFRQDPELATTIKLRVISRQQQLIRIDFENTPSHEVLNASLEDYERSLGECNLVLLSDYGKGGLTHIAQMIQMAREAGKPVLVDPKGDDYSRYRGASLLTPNRAELRQVVGRWRDEDDLQMRVSKLRKELELEALLLTRSEEGMTLYLDKEVIEEPARALEVFDVSGAGDTVIATLSVMLASGASMADAMRLANRAASIVVGKLGTAVASLEELRAAL